MKNLSQHLIIATYQEVQNLESGSLAIPQILTDNSIYLWKLKFGNVNQWFNICELQESRDELIQENNDSNRHYIILRLKLDASTYICPGYVINGFSSIIDDTNIFETTEVKSRDLTISYNLVSGDKILLMECDQIQESFPVEKSQILFLTGESMTKYSDDYWRVMGYKVTAPAIGKKNLSDYSTYTDIGGKWLAIEKNGEVKKIAHLANGYGDGDYTLRFRGNSIVR